MERNYPEIIISDEGVTWLDKGQMWMYKNNLEQCDPQIKNGELVDIVTNKGRYLGTGFISLKSHITVRILSKDRKEIIDHEFFKKRIQQAYDFRKTVEGDNLSNCRLIFGEADLLPGLVIDRYNDILVSQISSYGLEQIKDMIYEIVLDVLKADGEDVKGIYERNDIQIRTKEGLEQYKGYYKNKDLPTQTIINENGLLLHVDVENGQKTGYFLDQKSNRYLLRKIAHGKRVVDCFSHTGGFALNAAMGNASHVVSVDVSKTALDQGYQNAKLNHLEEKIDFVQADVFDYLDELKETVLPFKEPSTPQVTKVFRKVKKLKIPEWENMDLRNNTYVGWNDAGTQKKFILAYRENKLIGVHGTLSPTIVKGVCSICQTITNVSMFLATTKSGGDGTYTKKGNYICHDSDTCNQQLTQPEYLEAFMENVKAVK